MAHNEVAMKTSDFFITDCYNEKTEGSNMRYLERKMEDYKAGRLDFAEHELIEEQ